MNSPFSYTFTCAALERLVSGQPIRVVHWQGTEAVSRPYRFTVTLAVQATDVPLDKILNTPAMLSGYRPDGSPLRWHGIVTQGTQQGADETYDYYEIVLEPRLVRLRQTRWSDVYLNQQLDDLIRQLLRLANLEEPYSSANTPYDYRLVASQLAATRRAFTCQFEETCLDFLMRKLEFYGVYFWFEQGEDRESIVFANHVEQQPADVDDVVHYPRGIIDPDARSIAVTRLSRCVSMQPASVTLHSTNDLGNTTLSLVSRHNVPAPAPGVGEVHSATDYFENLSGESTVAGDMLATWRSEELACQRLRVNGEARTPGLRTGRMVSVSHARRGTTPTQYYVIEITHEGTQTLETAPATDKPAYLAQFVALPRWIDNDHPDQPLQYRPPRLTPVPVISQLVNGFIDIETPNQPKQFAQPDEYGRYRVRLMFPRQRYAGYQNSAWLRLATPFAGGSPTQGLNHAGMHFPLREGTEVIVGFLNGHPDRPVILSALSNVEAPSVVTAANAGDHVLQTPSGNMLTLRDSGAGAGGGAGGGSSSSSGSGSGSNDDPGSGRSTSNSAPDDVASNTASIVVSSPAYDSSLTLGTAPPDAEAQGGFILTTEANGTIQAENSMLIEVPGHLHISAGGGSALSDYLKSEISGLPKGISAGTSGGIVIEHFLGAKVSATEAIDIRSFIGGKVDLIGALEFCVKAAGVLGICYAVEKQINLSEKHEVTAILNKSGETITLTFQNWNLIAQNKQEELLTSTINAANSYSVLSLGEYLASAGDGASFLSMTPAEAVLLSTETNIAATAALSLEGASIDIAAAADLNMAAAVVTTEAESIDLAATANISLTSSLAVSCDAPLIQLG